MSDRSDELLLARLRAHRPTRFIDATPSTTSEPSRPATAVLYARVSVGGVTQSIPEQRDVTRAYAQAANLAIVGEFEDDGRSGVTIEGRPGLCALLRTVEAGGIGHVVAATTCRLARRAAVLHELSSRLEQASATMHDASRGPLESLTLSTCAFLAENDRDRALDLMNDGRRRMLGEGRAAGTVPFGYLAVPGRPGVRIPHPVEAGRVLRMYEQCLAGVSPSLIAAGACPPGHAASGTDRTGEFSWTATRVVHILRNATYKGVLTYGKTVTRRSRADFRRISAGSRPPEEWEAVAVPHMQVVDPELWDRVQEILSATSSGRSPRGSLELFAGRVLCVHCGQPNRRARDRRGAWPALWCTSMPECLPSRATVGIVERAVLSALGDHLRARRLDTGLTEEERRRWRDDLEGLDLRLSMDLRRTLDGLAVDAKEVARMSSRRASLGRVLRTGGDDTIDLGILLRRLDEAVAQAGSDTIVDPARDTAALVRGVVASVAVGRAGEGLTRVVASLDLGPVASQLRVDDLFPQIEVDVADPQQESGRDAVAKAARDRAKASETDAIAIHSPSAEVLEALDALGRRMTPSLAGLGWSLGALVRASSVALRCAVGVERQGDLLGPADTFLEACAVVAGSGLRGEAFVAAERDGSGLEAGLAHVCSRRPGFHRLAPGIERAIAADAIATLSDDGGLRLGGDLREAVAVWLRRAQETSTMPFLLKGDHDLTRALATIRVGGLAALLASGPLSADDLVEELAAWETAMGTGEARSAASIVVLHLRGAHRSEIAASCETSRGRVDHMVTRYRAAGPAGLSQKGPKEVAAGRALPALPWQRIVDDLRATRADDLPVTLTDVLGACASEYGRVVSRDTARMQLRKIGVALPGTEAAARPARLQTRANAFVAARLVEGS